MFSCPYGTYSSEEKAIGEKGPATALKLGTSALTRSFRHTSHRDRSRSLVPHCSYVPVTGVPPLPSDTYDLRLEAGTVCGVMVAGLAAPGMLHESVSLKGKAASIRS